MAKGTHDYPPGPRNETILINVNGAMTPRAESTVSVFDSGLMLGDGIWEGLRVARNHHLQMHPSSRQILGQTPGALP